MSKEKEGDLVFENLDSTQINALISAGSGLLGAVIGAGATLLSTWMANKIQKSGKVTLFVKNVYSVSEKKNSCGYYPMGNISNLFMEVPIWLEVCNTSGVSRVVRNVNLHAYYQEKEVAEFMQLQAAHDEKGRTIPFGENGAYTIVVPGNDARRFQMEFMLRRQDLPSDCQEFDELILTYFDEKNIIHAFHFLDVDKCWVLGKLDVPSQWITMDRECKYAR